MRTTLLLSLLAALSAACGSRGPALVQPVGETHTTSARPAVRAREQLIATEELAAKCALPDTSRDEPHFARMSADLRPRGEAILARVAWCLTAGPLRGRTVRVMGHADVRSDVELSQRLALARAYAVRDALLADGVPATAIEAGSRITPRTEQGASSPLDRTVALELVAETPGR